MCAWDCMIKMTAENRWCAPRPVDLGPARKQHTGTPFDEVFTNGAFWEAALSTRACDQNASPARAVRTDVCRTFKLASEVDPTDQSVQFPRDDWVIEVWKAAVVPGITVTVQSPTAVLVALPVAWPLLTRNCRWTGTYEYDVDFTDPCYLLRILLPDIVKSFEASEDARQLRDNGFVLQQDVVRHKKPAIDLDSGRPVTEGTVLGERLERSVILQYARSDRAAFVVRAAPAANAGDEGGEPSPNTHELLHFYPAMGLTKQHWAQQVLLARCHSHDMAVSVIDVIRQRLGVNSAASLVEAAAPNDHSTDADAVKAAFLSRLEHKCGGLRVKPLGEPLSDVPHQVTAVLKAAGPERDCWPGWHVAAPLIRRLSGNPTWINEILDQLSTAEADQQQAAHILPPTLEPKFDDVKEIEPASSHSKKMNKRKNEAASSHSKKKKKHRDRDRTGEPLDQQSVVGRDVANHR